MNGQTSWISSINAIWFDPARVDWFIGPVDFLGGNKGKISSYGKNGISSCPYDIAKDQWKYLNGKQGWTKVGDANEISIECSTGNEKYIISKIKLE